MLRAYLLIGRFCDSPRKLRNATLLVGIVVLDAMNHRASPVWVARARDWPADTRSNVYSNRLGRFHLPSCSRARLEQCRLIWSRVTRRRAMSARSGPPVVVDQRDDRCETRATRVIVITRVSYYATKRIGGKTIRERDTEGREARRGEASEARHARRKEERKVERIRDWRGTARATGYHGDIVRACFFTCTPCCVLHLPLARRWFRLLGVGETSKNDEEREERSSTIHQDISRTTPDGTARGHFLFADDLPRSLSLLSFSFLDSSLLLFSSLFLSSSSFSSSPFTSLFSSSSSSVFFFFFFLDLPLSFTKFRKNGCACTQRILFLFFFF